MTLDLDALREAYGAEVPIYRELVARAKALLEPALRAAGLDGHVEGREKDVRSFVLKALRKHTEQPEAYANPLTAITDKAGIRILVASLDEIPIACAVVIDCFDLTEPFEDTAQRYKPSELGYLGHHGQATLRPEALTGDDDPLAGRSFEIQVHTKAQNAWSTVSHPLLYKPVGGEPSPDVARKVYRAVALVSLFDEQLMEARMAVLADPAHRPAAMLAALRRQQIDWTAAPTDDETSLWILAAIAHLWPGDTFEATMDTFLADHRDALTVIYDRYADQADSHPLLLQPEALAIYQQLTTAPAVLADTWVKAGLPRELLESLKDVFGSG